MDIAGLTEILRTFVRERDWEKFHTPKNLAMALAGEAGEMLEIFQWLTPEESCNIMKDPARAEMVRDELADILVYCVRLADVLGIDPAEAIHTKLEKNRKKYPPEKVKGKANKYSEYT